MRKLLFLLPGTTKQFHCGGLWAELKTLALAQQVCEAEVVTYRQREPDHPYLPDILNGPFRNNVIFVVSWGFDVPKLVKQITRYPVVYHAHSSEYGFRLPARIPIVTVSRNTLGYWGQRSPHSLIYYLPNQISEEFQNHHRDRDIDVLVHARKSSKYLLNQLIPALQTQVKVEVIDGFVDSLAELFNRTKVYLYDSAEYWAIQKVTEGFGLQPLEAMACGCQVFSSVNHGLSDYLDPGFNCYKIAGYSTAFDTQRILNVLQTYQPPEAVEALLPEYRTDNILQRLSLILAELNAFFDHQQAYSSDITPLNPTRVTALRLSRILDKIKSKLSR